uniref:Uncharacterized protein n=1 Tax=Octopus bimaculoides TaxID=37653 RepID=A0A0L8HG28_OCTBM
MNNRNMPFVECKEDFYLQFETQHVPCKQRYLVVTEVNVGQHRYARRKETQL